MDAVKQQVTLDSFIHKFMWTDEPPCRKCVNPSSGKEN